MIWSTEQKIDFIDLAIDQICSGIDPFCAFNAAALVKGFSIFTVNELVSLENFANGGVFEGHSEDVENRINRLLKLRNYLQKALDDSRIR